MKILHLTILYARMNDLNSTNDIELVLRTNYIILVQSKLNLVS